MKPTDTDTATAVIAAYGLDDDSIATTQNSTERVLNFGNDVCFAVAAQAFARAWSNAGHEAFLYRFNCPNPWNGAWKGYATHILDLAFLLLNYNEYLSQGQRQNAERFAKDVITFVHGGEPWMAYRSGIQEGSMVYDAPAEGDLDRSEYVGWETPQLTGRRDIMQRIDDPGLLDRLMEGWQLFMAQK